MKFEKKKLIDLRLQHDLNQRQFSKKIKTSRQRVANWEDGECRPNVQAIAAICDAFDVSPNFFFVQN